MSARLVMLAAGGTGGHVFPAEALAAELLRRGCRVALVTDQRGSGFGDRLPGVELHRVSAGAMAGANLLDRAKSALRLAFGVWQARGLIGRLAPAVAVGFGGYPSVPTMLAACRAGLPTVLHEQNAVLGRANRLLAARANRIATSFPALQSLGRAEPEKLVMTGNPVRPAIIAVAEQPYPGLEAEGPVRLLVTGGSQGARVFGRVLPKAIAKLPEELRRRLRLTQQCRAEDLDRVRADYRSLGVEAELAAFFDDIPARLASAHLAIARAGASTCAELTAAGRPAVLVPYPFAADDHQSANARCVTEAGAGWLLPESQLSPESLGDRLQALLSDPHGLAEAAAKARAAGHRDAAERLADLVLGCVPGASTDGAETRPAEARRAAA